MNKDKTPVGSIRPSQLLWSYGPGSLIDLPNISVLTMGIDRWQDRGPAIQEARLLAAVRRALGPQVKALYAPPASDEDRPDPSSPAYWQGAPVIPFPCWLRCVRCGLLGEFGSGLFEPDGIGGPPEQVHFVHVNCTKGRKSDAVPARFLMACPAGHLDEFPWHWFVHQGPSSCTGTLRFFERGASLQTENLWVKCDKCDLSRSLVHAFGEKARMSLPGCRGRHPHLASCDEEECTEEPRTILLGATNGWFSSMLSMLSVPEPGASQATKLVKDGWTHFEDCDSEAAAGVIHKTLVKLNALPGLESISIADLWKEIGAVRAENDGGAEGKHDQSGDIKSPEWEALTMSPPTRTAEFQPHPIETPPDFANLIQDVVLLERLREVNALIGFTRVESPDDSVQDQAEDRRAPLCRGKPEWIPATAVHGEGIFIRFPEAAISAWEALPSVQKRSQMLVSGHRGWRTRRKIDPALGYPGIRYAMLHTVSHLLIRELALACGYNASSIRERIYATGQVTAAMAGILLYTAAPDADGTLGGLVDLGKPSNLDLLIRSALVRASICSSDPLCGEHKPGDDQSCHNASCHACSFVAETSCERGNRYLDRALLIPTFECIDAGYFRQIVNDHG